MKISIITVVHNNAETIEDTILSVAAQCYQDIEHLIVDGGSTDGTLAIIEKHRAKLATVISEPDRGIYDAMNKGLKLATGKVVGFLNADDIYADNGVLEQVAQSFANLAVDASYADLVYVDRVDVNKVIRYWKSCEYRQGLFEKGWMPAHPTFFVNRNIYQRFGGFDLHFTRQADFELTMRLLAVHRVRSVYIPRIWVRMRTGGLSNNTLSGILKGNLEAYQACKKHGLQVNPLFIGRKILSRLPEFFARVHHAA